MLAFSSARRAVSCAKSIQHRVAGESDDGTPRVRVRIGIHTGDALREADEFFGTTVHYAAQVPGHALGGGSSYPAWCATWWPGVPTCSSSRAAKWS